MYKTVLVGHSYTRETVCLTVLTKIINDFPLCMKIWSVYDRGVKQYARKQINKTIVFKHDVYQLSRFSFYFCKLVNRLSNFIIKKTGSIANFFFNRLKSHELKSLPCQWFRYIILLKSIQIFVCTCHREVHNTQF